MVEGIAILLHNPHFITEMDEYNVKNPDRFCFNNGILYDLLSKEFRRIKPCDYVFQTAGYGFGEKAFFRCNSTLTTCCFPDEGQLLKIKSLIVEDKSMFILIM